jgi:predicted phage baseplate assembly protein
VLPQIDLDDVRFQALVSEARTRIVQHSPEWTDHNVSDPGITLIESFAWLTELLIYRINRIPERLHTSLLSLVGVTPGAATCATAHLRFLVSRPGRPTVISAGTELASPRTADGDSIIFQTTAELTIPASCGLAAYAVQRADQVQLGAMDGEIARPAGPQQAPFATPPGVGDGLLLGFDSSIAGLVVALAIECSRAEGDFDQADPPLVWEASVTGGGWHAATLLSDDTGGFRLGGGVVTLEVPPTASVSELAGERRYWLRCRVVERTRGGARGAYYRSPEITAVTAAVVGATAPASHAASVVGEMLGIGDGIPGVTYALQHRPVLALGDDETLEVREAGSRWTPWQRVDSFSLSDPTARHFMLDETRGEVRFGPAIRQPDGGWRRYGAVPPAGSVLRMGRYRHGGGAAGNVAPRGLTILPQPIANVASATNPRAATGGVDAELIESARERARLEVRARSRAVTGEDVERLTLAASPRVARAICVGPDGSGPVRVHVLPRVAPADRLLDAWELTPDAELMQRLASELDQYRLLGTGIRLLPVRLRGVSVVVDVRASPLADLERVQHDVAHAMYVYLNPLIGGSSAGAAEGWPLGRALNLGELFGIAYAIDGVEFVNILRMYETDLVSGEQAPQPTDSRLLLAPDELIASGRHIVKAIHRD